MFQRIRTTKKKEICLATEYNTVNCSLANHNIDFFILRTINKGEKIRERDYLAIQEF